MIILIEIRSVDGVVRAATGSGWQAGAEDALPFARWEPTVADAGSFEASALTDAGALAPVSAVTFGQVRLVNADRRYDALLDWSFDAATVTWWRIDASARVRGPALMTARVENVSWTDRFLDIALSDPLAAALDRAPVDATFRGDNAGPEGVEGAGDLKGKPKPWLIGGPARFLPVPLVNASTLTCQISIRPATPLAVWDRGSALTLEASPRASLAALTNATVSGGQVAWWSGVEGSYLKLGSIPAGTVTVTAETAAGTRSATSAITELLTIGDPGVAFAAARIQVDPAARAAPDVAWWSGTQPTSIRSALSEIAAAAGVLVLPRRDGTVRLQRLSAIRGEPVAEIRPDQILRSRPPQLIASTDDRPAWRVTISYGRNHWPASSSDLAGVAQADIELRRQPWLAASASAPERRTRFPRARDLALETALVTVADAVALATRHLATFAEPRRTYEITVPSPVADDLDLGDWVRVTAPVLGLGAGQVLLITARTQRFSAATATLRLWG
jgi:hypothetical protein